MSRTEALVVAAAFAYLVMLGLAMQFTDYDEWGALVVVPVIVVASGPILGRMFRGSLLPLRRIAWAGLAAKLAGGVAGYLIRVDAYGAGDALRYDRAGKRIAGDVWAGDLGVLEAIPTSTGTRFLEELTGFVYVFVGSSRLAGFIIFSWFSYLGLVFVVKAAAVAVPQLNARLFAVVVFFFPSIVYWGSSIGKEAVIGLSMGIGIYGAALLLRDRRRGGRALTYLAAGVVGSAIIRPHFAALLIGAVAIGALARLVRDVVRRSRSSRNRSGGLVFGTFTLAFLAVVAFAFVTDFMLDYFAPVTDDSPQSVTDRFGSIFDLTSARTSQGGSSFEPLEVNGPIDFPYAALRTLTRPLVNEARSVQELMPAVEMGVLFVFGLMNWRRLAHVPKMMLSTPFVMFAVVAVFTFGVAFSSIANTGLLVRQRSLILPLFLLLWCLPPLPKRVTAAPAWRSEPRFAPERVTVGARR